MKKHSIILLSFLGTFFFACNQEDLEEPVIGENIFSNSELELINQVLNLGATTHNYSNMELPFHYTSEEASISDNTPVNNQITDMGTTLGRVLFYDKNLSIDNTISCASCHEQKAAFSDNNKFSIGLNGQLTRRNSMTIINSRFYEQGSFFWDERALTLEEQALMPIQDHTEMGMELEELEIKLQQLDYYPILFEKAFNSSEVNSVRIAQALSQFMRSIVSIDSRFDQGFELAGFPEDEEQMPDFPNFTDQENLGLDIF